VSTDGENQEVHAAELFAEAEELLSRGHTGQARELYLRVLEIDPRHAPAHNKVGVIHAQAGDLDAARAAFDAALAVDPECVPAISNMGNILFSQGRLDEALQYYRKAVDLDPEYATAWNNMAAVYQRQGDMEAKVRCIKKSRRLYNRQAVREAREGLRRRRLGCLGAGALFVLAAVLILALLG